MGPLARFLREGPRVQCPLAGRGAPRAQGRREHLGERHPPRYIQHRVRAAEPGVQGDQPRGLGEARPTPERPPHRVHPPEGGSTLPPLSPPRWSLSPFSVVGTARLDAPASRKATTIRMASGGTTQLAPKCPVPRRLVGCEDRQERRHGAEGDQGRGAQGKWDEHQGRGRRDQPGNADAARVA